MNHNVEPQNDRMSSADPAQDTVINNILTASGELDARKAHTELHLPGGQVLRVPTSFLFRHPGQDRNAATEPSSQLAGTLPEDSVVIPVLEEQLQVSKRTVPTGKVLVEKHVQQYQETLDVPLAVRTFDIERVVLNRPVQAAPAVRQEGDTTIYSLVEEQLVLTTQLVLKEEVRVTRRDTERRDTRTVTLNREILTVTRSRIDAKAASGKATT